MNNKNIPHYNGVRFIVGSYKGGDKVFLAGNAVILQKMMRTFNS